MGETEKASEAKRTTVGPASVLAYLDPNYWNERFTSEDHYEWLKDYSHFRHLIHQHIKPDSSVLELGCGNSQLSDELYNDGITNITCIDLSSVAVEKMQKRFFSKGYKGVKVLEGNMLNLSFADESFDVVIEKGTMDVLFVDSGDPWNPRPEAVNNAMAMLQGVHRVLKPNGIFISIAFGQPHFRRPLFNAPEFTWSIDYTTFGDGFHYFFYVLRKGCKLLDANADVKKVETPTLCLYQDELDNEDYLFRTNIDETDDQR
ncbi:putative endothelin-converting enzyme 1 [Helianthus annuus]|uniref:EEF1A lysine methyltransferase 4 n=1 Tax=Helianthus annuus TaxID=4232 RepID=A0A251SB93_HELAN|nr:EEF1A lysine methyltransferase 4 [Helianthus annuus]KAF5758781.1 putative endothelin-converting enzyme 1 [Helianthus annuus]KAJ0437075.1 putative endothelin-converting enzyme 1 [Helianthus annuus]KAJ0459386.1 putative endothelin-converting enzyme 1 [Helianthus annuus]KAJ0643876.1 putative endothelin-converting enzyme 1 [Helianthus annuus]KAJ0820066.1 putative endothelin-converting enzyme 1 [Helianthus annuus]